MLFGEVTKDRGSLKILERRGIVVPGVRNLPEQPMDTGIAGGMKINRFTKHLGGPVKPALCEVDVRQSLQFIGSRLCPGSANGLGRESRHVRLVEAIVDLS